MEIKMNKEDIIIAAAKLGLEAKEMFEQLHKLHILSERAAGWRPAKFFGGQSLEDAGITYKDRVVLYIFHYGGKWNLNERLSRAFERCCWIEGRFNHPSYREVIWMLDYVQ